MFYESDGRSDLLTDEHGNRYFFPHNDALVGLRVGGEHELTTDRAHFLAAAPRSSGWRKVEKDHLEMQPVCMGCGGTVFLQVHHVAPFHIHPELELDPKNLLTLCMNPNRICHFRLGHCFDWHAFNPHVKEDAHQQVLRIQKRLYKEVA